MKSITVNKNEAGQRLDKLLGKYLNLAGKGFLYKMMRKKNIVLNGKKCDGSEKLAEGDEIKLFLADETIEKFSEVKIQKVKKTKLHIIYEDEHVLLINKPSGMLSQKAKEQDESRVLRNVLSFQNLCCLGDILFPSAGAASDIALI